MSGKASSVQPNMKTNIDHIVPVLVRVIGSEEMTTVDGRVLHSNMGVKRDFSNWIKRRINSYGFQQGLDFEVFEFTPNLAKNKRANRGRPEIEYILSLDMAKELAMVENNEKGRQIRRYFIQIEKAARKSIGQLQGEVLSAIQPANRFGSKAPNGKERIGVRRASFVASPHRLQDAEKLSAASWQLEFKLLSGVN